MALKSLQSRRWVLLQPVINYWDHVASEVIWYNDRIH